jgi:hypothetical protein
MRVHLEPGGLPELQTSDCREDLSGTERELAIRLIMAPLARRPQSLR